MNKYKIIILIGSLAVIIALIFLIYRMNQCTVKFVVDNEVYETIHVMKNKSIIIEPPTKEGYEFAGWINENNETLNLEEGVSASGIYYAIWAIIEVEEE